MRWWRPRVCRGRRHSAPAAKARGPAAERRSTSLRPKTELGKPRSTGKSTGLKQLSKQKLYERATAQHINGRSNMTREQLLAALERVS